MNKAAVKDFAYGGLMELINNRHFYYKSSTGSAYSHLTEEGKEAVADFIGLLAHKMIEAENADLNERAKRSVIDQLKGK